MTHELLLRALDAHRANALLAGQQLRDAAQHLLTLCAESRPIVLAYDPVGERIIGAALALSDSRHVVPADRTAMFPGGTFCLLVGGLIAGPVGVADCADEARQAGAARVDAAVLGGWQSQISGVDRIHALGSARAAVA